MEETTQQAQIPHEEELSQMSADDITKILNKSYEKYATRKTSDILVELDKPLSTDTKIDPLGLESIAQNCTAPVREIYENEPEMRQHIRESIEEIIESRYRLSKLEILSKVLNFIGKDINKATKSVVKGLGVLYAYPTYIRNTHEERDGGEETDGQFIGTTTGFMYGIVNIIFGIGAILTIRDEGKFLALPTAIYLTTNALSGAYEYIRYKAKKVKVEKLQEKLKNGIK